MMVPLSPEESSLLILQWAYDQEARAANRERSSPLEAPSAADAAVELQRTANNRKMGRLAASRPRSTKEVAARLRHLVAMLAARETLVASFGRMDRQVIPAANERTEPTSAMR